MSVAQARAELGARLRARSGEIEDAIFALVQALSGPVGSQGREYMEGVRAVVTEALDYALASIEEGSDRTQPIPAGAVEQARRAAQTDVSLDMVMRRYAAGDRVFGMFVVDEAESLPRDVRQEIQRTHSVPMDRLMAAVALEYEEEVARLRQSSTHRLRERVNRLVTGDLDEDAELAYDFDAWHVGVLAAGPIAKDWIGALARDLDCQSLVVEDGGRPVWIWFGRRRFLPVGEVEAGVQARRVASDTSLALGEARYGLEGWRLTHGEARAVLDTSSGQSQPMTRCRDVVLVAAVARDPVLSKSLFASYLAPLDEERGVRGESGSDLRKTLIEYFAAGQNATSAAAALKVDRLTVRRRLLSIEDRLGQRIEECHAELQVALRAEQVIAARSDGQTEHHPPDIEAAAEL